ncbi:DnaJ domain-containing protein [Infundibulicybe gibba]|nr:DnaJ domain-containing protein [Infundibulicybe gibba]
MTDVVDPEADAGASGAGGFSDEVDPTPSLPKNKARPSLPRKAPSPPPEADLLSPEPTAYVSPLRRARPTASPGSSTPPTHATPRASTPSAPPLPQNPPVSASALRSAQQHRSTGTAHFKLGQHAAAESAYTTAIGCLPAGHRALVPLYNNRALARLRMGEHRGAAEDAGSVLALFDAAGVRLAAGPGARRGADGAGVKGEGDDEDAWEWGDAMMKALKRRAEALEGRERWPEARADWEVLAGAAWAGERARGEGVRGVGRCRKMAGGESSMDGPAAVPKSTPQPRPKPRPRPAAVPAPPSTALKTLRQASSAQEAEDTERAQLKDRVDGIILAWKAGKETNIRALLAGLGVVLWPGLGVEPCGMHELVSPKQVKVRYMRVIGRLHPDKLNAGNTTLEQRMIANAVFGILNEAWNAFKQ